MMMADLLQYVKWNPSRSPDPDFSYINVTNVSPPYAKNVNDLRSLVHLSTIIPFSGLRKVTSPDEEADPLPNAGRVALSKKYRTARNPNCESTSPDDEADPLPNAGRVALSKNYRTARNPNSDTPKTSEYAFFKKLKKNIGHSNSDLLHRGRKLSKIIQPSNCISEKEHQTNEYQSFSPVDGVIVHQNAGISKEAKLKSFSLLTAVTPVYSNLRLSPLAGLSNNSEFLAY